MLGKYWTNREPTSGEDWTEVSGESGNDELSARYPTQSLPVINPGNAMRQRKIWLYPAHLRLAQHKQTLIINNTSFSAAIESTFNASRKQFNRSRA